MDSEWKETENKLQRLFVFEDFKEALEFVNKVGEIAEKQNHHPDITLQNYNQVFVSTTTHNAGNMVTEKDHEFAKAVNTPF